MIAHGPDVPEKKRVPVSSRTQHKDAGIAKARDFAPILGTARQLTLYSNEASTIVNRVARKVLKLKACCCGISLTR
jgi:hypothetical protein